MATEFELKYRCSPDVHSRILAAFPGAWTQTPMSTTYYDTADGRLSRHHWTLRHRREGGRDVCTLKTPAPGGARDEWELECSDIARAIPRLAEASGCEELTALAAQGLAAVCGARFTRRSCLLTPDGCTAELALDEGVLLGGEREIPLCETELELKSGDPEALLAFAAAFQAEFGLSIEPKSKFARAKALAQED